MLIKAMAIRQKYMSMASQSFPSVAAEFLSTIDGHPKDLTNSFEHADSKTIKGTFSYSRHIIIEEVLS